MNNQKTIVDVLEKSAEEVTENMVMLKRSVVNIAARSTGDIFLHVKELCDREENNLDTVIIWALMYLSGDTDEPAPHEGGVQ